MIRGLPEFYRRHLGEALQNQLWLVTHSDALIREAVGKPGFNVFHMLPCGAETPGTSQLKPLAVSKDLDSVLADLVGDLAAYRPGGKGVIFEGGGDSDFDKTFAGAVFADDLQGINLISGTNKIRVKLLHEVLERAYLNGDLPTKFYAITDRDTDDRPDPSPALSIHQWDVYHIENYLLDSRLIAEVLNSFDVKRKYDVGRVDDALVTAARNVVPGMLIHRMRTYVNTRVVSAIDLGFDPNTLTVGRDLYTAAKRSEARVTKVMSTDLSEDKLVSLEQSFRAELEQTFSDGSWRSNLPGREILKQLVRTEAVPVGYELLRNLLMSRMVQEGVKPAGMQRVIDAIRQD